MASADIEARLAELTGSGAPQQEKINGYQRIADLLANSTSDPSFVSSVGAFTDSLLDNNLGIVPARPLLASLVEKLQGIVDNSVKTEACQRTLQSLAPWASSFEEQDRQLREILADTYTKMEEYGRAAQALEGINLDSSQRKMTDEEKVQILMRICRLWLEDEDTVKAEAYLNKMKGLIHNVRNEELSLTFQLSQARIMDSSRRFLDASQAYHNVSLHTKLVEEERNRCLSKAITCAVLAPAGPPRSRALAKLYKDERCPLMAEYGILEKMFLDRIISPDEVNKFASGLDEHQLAQSADGTTVLSKAIIEHNLVGTSKLYSNITVTELARLLDLDTERAEEYAARMLEQGRLKGSIDQIMGAIYFDQAENEAFISSQVTSPGLSEWNRRVQALVEDVERVSSLV
jgi:COP9 signalosome complex subunit 4